MAGTLLPGPLAPWKALLAVGGRERGSFPFLASLCVSAVTEVGPFSGPFGHTPALSEAPLSAPGLAAPPVSVPPQPWEWGCFLLLTQAPPEVLCSASVHAC